MHALHHSSIVLFKSLRIDHREMRAQVTIGVQDPERVDTDAVRAELPRVRPEVKVVHGGLNVHDPDNATTHVIATAAIAALLPIEDGDWRLCAPAG